MSIKPCVLGALVWGCVAAPAMATTVTFDFSAYAPGTIPGAVTAGGVEVSFVGISRTNEIRVLDTTDSRAATGWANDPDLAGPFDDATDGDEVTDRAFGNALILQEQGSALLDDEAAGGTIQVLFSKPVTLDFVAMLDIDSGASIFVNGGTDAVAQGQTVLHGLPHQGPNQWYGFDLAETNVTRFDVTLGSSGALGEFVFTVPEQQLFPTPVPPALPMLGAGMAALVWVRRRHRGS